MAQGIEIVQLMLYSGCLGATVLIYANRCNGKRVEPQRGRELVMSERRHRPGSASKLRAILDGAGSALDVGLAAPLPRYRGPEADAAALQKDQRTIGDDFRRACSAVE